MRLENLNSLINITVVIGYKLKHDNLQKNYFIYTNIETGKYINLDNHLQVGIQYNYLFNFNLNK